MPYKPGESGNPAGRPKKGQSMADVMAQVLEEDVQGMEKKEALVRKIIKLAFDGESWAMQQVFDRMDGKPRQVIEQNNRNLDIQITKEDADAVT